MDASPFDALTRAFALGERTRRETLRLLLGTGTGLAALATLANAEAKKKHREKKKHKKKKTKGDSRCKDRDVISSNGICIDLNDQAQVAAVLCSALQGCICVTDTKGARACIDKNAPVCEAACISDADCDPDTICVNIGGCCPGNPVLARTCAIPCPPL